MFAFAVGWVMPLGAQIQPVESLPAERNLAALKAVADPLSEAIEELNSLSKELKSATTEERKQELGVRVEAEKERILQLRTNFRDIVGGSEAAEYETKEEQEKSMGLQEQVSEVLQPLVGALREPTSQLREREELREELAEWEARKTKTDKVLDRIAGLESKAEDARVKSELATARRLWEGRQAEASGQVEVLSVKVEERDRMTPTLWQALSSMFKGFWKTRGLNVLLAIAVALIAYIGIRKLYQWTREWIPATRKSRKSLVGRASDILSIGLAVLSSIIGVLLVFYIRGDWLLLTLAAVLLISALWAGKNALPPYLDQIRILLNLGSVREGERLIYRDLPWRVKSLGFYTILSNPNLDGGELRVPLRDVMGMVSRVADEKEPWFPTNEDDWVVLEGDILGKVIRQTPEQVVVLKLGGSLQTYQIEKFLTLNPENLSRGFRVSSTFGIDYRHQDIATSVVLETLSSGLQKKLFEEFGRELVRSVSVEFKAAGLSSLDYEILVDFSGELASRYRYINRLIQRVCLDVCNEHGWTIPFTQVTVHQAD